LIRRETSDQPRQTFFRRPAANDGDTLVGFQAVTNKRIPTMTKPKQSKIDGFIDNRKSAAALMHQDQLFHAASGKIDGQCEAQLQTWSFEEACVMLNTEIDTLANHQTAFLRAKAGKPIMGCTTTSLINRDDTLARLLIAYGHYLSLRPEVK
jgi:hypothetical protein